MFRRHCWFMAASTSSSLLGPSASASGTQKLYCGCPAAKPPVVGTCFQPSSRSRETTASAASSLASAGTSSSVWRASSAMAVLMVAACHRRVTTGGPMRMPNAPCPLRYSRSGVEPGVEVLVQPADVRALRKVGQVPLEPRHLPVEHEAHADRLGPPSSALNQPMDSPRHSFLTSAQAGVWRKLTDGRSRMWSRCSGPLMGWTRRAGVTPRRLQPARDTASGLGVAGLWPALAERARVVGHVDGGLLERLEGDHLECPGVRGR